MGIDPTIKYFGNRPTTIVFQGSAAFDGTAQTGEPTLSPGLYVFPLQAGGGLYDFHEECIEVKQISYVGTGNLTVERVITQAGSPVMTSLIATIGASDPMNLHNFFLNPGEALKFTGGGASPKVSITASLGNPAPEGTP